MLRRYDTDIALTLRYKRPGEDESFGILLPDYQTVRHPWLVEQLESIMMSPP